MSNEQATVLIVDDNLENLDLLFDLLNGSPFQTREYRGPKP